ncbi:MAG TPA: serine/threonine-protein kinase [Kofleriaceae bacterium]
MADDASIGPTMISNASGGEAPASIPDARYEIGPEIARGGMGRVVEATDTFLGRVVALKEALADDKDSIERFARETRITARLEHPAIVPVHDGGIGSNGMPYYVMRKIGGTQLERLVATAESLGDRLALIPHVVATAQAVAHAHERGIVHRDIKPSNILIGELGETILIDWGLAKLIGETDEPSTGRATTNGDLRTNDLDTIQTRAGIVFGTPGFMAPEQLRAGPVDPRWDVYALGATLYHLLSRKPPHYAKSADEMMLAAIKAPPQPIGERVAGVPPELSAIVDKALAFDLGQRYADAKQIAEDLTRFTKGQLVAAHHYTPRERIAKFIRQHRAEVLTSLGALVLLLVLGTLAVVRIVRERNRADHAAIIARKAQHEAEDNAEELRLGQARALASSNPTLAIALLAPLAEKRWQDVRVIAAQARASGVAWGLPASRTTHALAMSPDGLRAVSVGDDGRVRLYDLVAHSSRDLFDAKIPVEARFSTDGKQVVLWAQQHITLVDLATGTHRDIAQPHIISSLALAGTNAYWSDPDGAVWQLDLAATGASAIQLPTDDKITLVAASPRGTWIALAGTRVVWLYDSLRPTEPVQRFADTYGHARAFDWSTDGSRLAILDDQQIIDTKFEDGADPRVVHQQMAGDRSFVLQVKDRLYTTSATNVSVMSTGFSGLRKAIGHANGLEEARNGSVVAGSDDVVEILRDAGDHFLAAPNSRISHVSASPASPYVIAAVDDRLLEWNLDDVEPQELATMVDSAYFVGNDQVLTTSYGGYPSRVDLRTQVSKQLDELPPIEDVLSSPNGQRAAAITTGHRALVLGPDASTPPIELPGDVDRAGWVSETQLVLATDAGTISLYDTQSDTRTPIVDRSSTAQLTGIAWSPGTVGGAGWVAATFSNNTLWRTQITRTPGAGQTVVLSRSPTSNLRIGPDGVVFVALGSEVSRWDGGADITHHAVLPVVVTHLADAPAALYAFAADGTLYSVDPARPDSVMDTREILGAARASMSPETGLIAINDRGALDLLDPASQQRWRLAGADTGKFTNLALSRSGRRVLAISRGASPGIQSTLVTWPVELPSTPAETAAWLGRLTNAVTVAGAKSLGWK